MKKKLLIAALAGVALASCTNEDFVGVSEVETPPSAENMISFGGAGSNLTRAAATGADAAALLNNQFTVLGNLVNGETGATETVFDNYIVKYDGNVGGDETNVYGWTYLTTPGQNIKYWNLSATKYDFVAFSGYDASKRIASTEANTLENIDATTIQGLFAADRVTANYTGSAGVQYGNKVTLNFKRMTSRVRFGIYETVPGYAVKNVRFYYGDKALSSKRSDAVQVAGLRGQFPSKANYKVTYDANNAVVSNVEPGAVYSDQIVFGALDYQTMDASNGEKLKADGSSDATGDKVFLGTSSSTVSFAKQNATLDGAVVANSAWQPVLPNEANDKNIVLRVDYDLVPLDGGATPGSVIHVYNAAAVVPATWAMWKPNYAYTYIFKISDQTSGQTTPPGMDPDKDTDGDGIPDIDDPDDDGDGIPDVDDPDDDGDGIPDEDDPDFPTVPDPDEENPNPNKPAVSPIVFDAEVSSVEDYNDETITGVTGLGGNAITTYSKTSNVTNAAEYAVGETIKLSSVSHGQWKLVHTATETTEQQVADNNTFSYDIIAGAQTGSQTIDEASVYTAEFTVEQPGYYIVWLRYLPTGLADQDGNYVDIFKVIKTHQ